MGNINPTLNCLKSGDKDKEQDTTINNIKIDIKNIRDNHLVHIESDMAEVRLDIKLIHRDIRDILNRLN